MSTSSSLCGVILHSHQPQALVDFYQATLGVQFELEEHGDLAPHYGVDLGQLHFAIFPLDDLIVEQGKPSTMLAFNVPSLASVISTLEALGTPCIQPKHNQGFGDLVRYQDPDGNHVEFIELDYAF